MSLQNKEACEVTFEKPSLDDILAGIAARKPSDEKPADDEQLEALAGLIHQAYTPEEILALKRRATDLLDVSYGQPQVLRFVNILGGQVHDPIPLDVQSPVYTLRQVTPEVVVERLPKPNYWLEQLSIVGIPPENC